MFQKMVGQGGQEPPPSHNPLPQTPPLLQLHDVLPPSEPLDSKLLERPRQGLKLQPPRSPSRCPTNTSSLAYLALNISCASPSPHCPANHPSQKAWLSPQLLPLPYTPCPIGPQVLSIQTPTSSKLGGLRPCCTLLHPFTSLWSSDAPSRGAR